ncbi:MAG TPA: hypothetical protein VGZ93_10545 [Candidatus Methylacidiphilales bacterium]|jgi:hypothetical protein|nr:hypothetical protein [Candidatus Methylacidiphilales bacterium]
MGQFHKGMRFRTRREINVRGIIVFGAPFSNGFEGTLPKGEVLILDSEPRDSAKGMWLIPERYKHFELLFVPERDRLNPDYGNYAVGCAFNQVGTDIELTA